MTIVEGVFHPNGRLEELYKQPVPPIGSEELRKMQEIIEYDGTEAGVFEIKAEGDLEAVGAQGGVADSDSG